MILVGALTENWKTANAGREYMEQIGSTPISPPLKLYAARDLLERRKVRVVEKLSPILSPSFGLQS